MDIGVRGLRALVTGGSRGLGLATATLLAREGATVTINARDAVRLKAAADSIGGYAVVGNLRDAAAPAVIVAEAAGLMGGIDLLFCNAGGPPSGPFETFGEDAW